jgi:tRNA pseudouridine55 synthase
MTHAEPSPSGLLVVDKPLRLTSMTVCRGVKRRLIAGGAPPSVKVGHAGTLDPLATGVVVVLVGKATRLCDDVMAGEKQYLADVDFSRVSTTDDLEGECSVVPVSSLPTHDQVEAACTRFVGVIAQRPPVHSAIWVDGRRSYHLARAGKAETLPERPVVIHAIALLKYAWPLARLDVRCGKGTYIRSLARDLGRSLGVGGMLVALRRTRVGGFTIDRATPLNDLPERLDQAHLIPLPQG